MNSMKKNSSKQGIILFVFMVFHGLAHARDVVLLDNTLPAEKGQKEAILILPGFGTIMHNTKSQKEHFQNRGYDVYIPDYISRKSIAKSVENIKQFYAKHELERYKKVHVFSYIIGSWAINTWLVENDAPQNIRSVIYDRSPMQEKAPQILAYDHPLLSRLLFGKLIFELAETPYPPLPKNNRYIGILVECKATKLMWKKRKSLENYSEVLWETKDFGQTLDDIARLFIDHDDLYAHCEKFAPSVFYFIKNQQFPDGVERIACAEDPFATYLDKK